MPPPGAGLNSLTLCIGAVSRNALKKSVLASHMTEPCLPIMQAGLLPLSQQRDSLQLHNATPIAQQVRHHLQVSAVNLHVHALQLEHMPRVQDIHVCRGAWPAGCR